MPRAVVVNACAVVRTPRVMQVEGMFGLEAASTSEKTWSIDWPLDEREWNIGLIVGPSGAGKSTVARAMFGEQATMVHPWPADRSIIDGFPPGMGVKEIVGLLSSVGLASPPSWLRPFERLSTGEQFRAGVARSLAVAKIAAINHSGPGRPPIVVIDEFTSVVDRTVAQIGSSATAKAVRRAGMQFVAVTCHYDVQDWLQPNWVYEPASGDFSWRRLRRRPDIVIEVRRGTAKQWSLFHHHHYLSAQLHPQAKCFVGWIDGRPAVFTAVLPFPHNSRPGWREHRTVCLPDFQGVGIGNAFSEYIASLFAATGKPYRSVTGSPAMIRHRAKSTVWKMTRPPSRMVAPRNQHWRATSAHDRITASFEFVGANRRPEAIRFGLM